MNELKSIMKSCLEDYMDHATKKTNSSKEKKNLPFRDPQNTLKKKKCSLLLIFFLETSQNKEEEMRRGKKLMTNS